MDLALSNVRLLEAAKQATGDRRLRVIGSADTNFSHQLRLDSPSRQLVVKAFEADDYRTEDLQAAVAAFQRNLQNLGVPLVSEFTLILVDGQLVEISSWEGENLEEYLAGVDDAEAFEVLKATLRRFEGFLLQPRRPYFITGVDLKFDNLALRGGERVARFVDVNPPLVLLNGVYHVHNPRPKTEKALKSHLERKFSPWGVVRRVFYSMIALRPHWGEHFWHLLHQAVGRDALLSAYEALFGIPSMHWGSLSADQKRQLIEEAPVSEIDFLRELGALVIPYTDPISRRADMHHVFELTTGVRTNPPPQYDAPHAVRVQRLKDELLTYLPS